ncbi:MAG TPA: TraR/DksA family transcriptional regulator [Patescibacteria group bacterium]|nr:TraR/DksA family transcriptional regulator [Patescibacteria group bacterium]
MLDEKFIRDRKADLEKAKFRLENELGKVSTGKGKDRQALFPDIGSKEDESAQEVEMYESSLSLEKGMEQKLNEINIALDKIEKGKYGYCENCRKEIPKDRLKAYPEATTCLNCH